MGEIPNNFSGEVIKEEIGEKNEIPKNQLDIRAGTAAGYAYALLATVNYEKERGRKPVPSINIGLSRALSEARGVQNIKGAIQFAEDMGLEVSVAEVLKAHRDKVWLGIHEEKGVVYITDEPFESKRTE